MNKRGLCLLLAVMLVFGCCLNVLAATSTEVKKQQTETKNKLNQINKDINAIESKKNQMRAQLSNLNDELVDTLLTLEVLEADLQRKQEEIDAAQKEYEKFKQLEEEQYQAMKLRIQYMYEKGSVDYIAMLMEAESISDLLNKADFVKEVSDYDDAKLTEYVDTKEKVAEAKIILEEEQEELKEVEEAQQIYKKELDKKISLAKSKVANFETELANAQKKAKEYQATIKKQNALIVQLQEEERKAEEDLKQKEEMENAQSPNSNDKPSVGDDSSAGDDSSSDVSIPSDGSLGVSIANYALKFVGNPYVFGGTSLTNGADCSGFTMSVHKHFGISIPRSSTDQSYGGKSVSINAVQPGDTIYYGNHVGIYIGNGQIVHASTAKTGIKISNYMYRTPIRVSRYW